MPIPKAVSQQRFLPRRALTSSLSFAVACALLLLLQTPGLAAKEWPLSNDPAFDASVHSPAFPPAEGPRILLDKAHHNFFVQWGIIDPFRNLAKANGFQSVIGDEPFTPEYLARFDIVMIITALPFDFTTRTEVTTETTFTDAALVQAWRLYWTLLRVLEVPMLGPKSITGGRRMTPKSKRIGLSVAAFPDVCKTPAPGGPIPIPYPNVSTARAGANPGPAVRLTAGFAGAVGNSAAAAQSLRTTMQTLHSQLTSMPGTDPNRWHELLDRYMQTTAELYKVLAPK